MFATPSQASPLSLTSVTADAASLDCSYSPRPSVASKAWDVRSLTANASTPRFYHLCPGLLRHSCDCETCALHVAHTLGLSHPAVHEPAGSWKERACARHTSARASGRAGSGLQEVANSTAARGQRMRRRRRHAYAPVAVSRGGRRRHAYAYVRARIGGTATPTPPAAYCTGR
jgi:hypothetical protein